MAKKALSKPANGIERLFRDYLNLSADRRAQLEGGLVLAGPVNVIGKTEKGKIQVLSSTEKGASLLEVSKADVLLGLATQHMSGAAVLWLRKGAAIKHVKAKKGSTAPAAEWLKPGAELDKDHFQFGVTTALRAVGHSLSLTTCKPTC